MPPKSVSNYTSNPRTDENINTKQQIRQPAPPQNPVLNQPQHQPQPQPQPQTGLSNYPEQIYPHSSNYHQHRPIGNMPASNMSNGTGAAVPRSSHFAHNSLPSAQVSGQQRMSNGPAYHQQAMYPQDNSRGARPAAVLSTSNFTHTQQHTGPNTMQARLPNPVPVQQQPHHDGHHELGTLPQRQQSSISYQPYQNHSSQQYTQFSGTSSSVQAKSESQIIGARSNSAPLLAGVPGKDPVSTSHMQAVPMSRSQLAPDLSIPPSRFVSTYDESTIEQRITGYYSKQSSDFASLIKLIQDTSADYPCVFSDSLVADLIGASSLSSPSQGHIRVIGLTLQHMLTCVLEKAHELSVATNPEGSSILTDADVKNALAVLGFTSLTN